MRDRTTWPSYFKLKVLIIDFTGREVYTIALLLNHAISSMSSHSILYDDV